METGRNELSTEILPVLDYYQTLETQLQKEDSRPKIKEGEALSSVASFYERLRYTIDYKKEHLLRRNAIERILKRVLWEKGEADIEKLAEALIKELIWARYIKNDFYPLEEVTEISSIVSKYLFLAGKLAGKPPVSKSLKWKDWLIAIASCEIEEHLEPSLVAFDVLSMAIESWFEKRFTWVNSGLDEKEKENQLAIAIHRSLFRSDEPKNAYYLLRRSFKNWNRVTIEEIDKKSEEIYEIFLKIRAGLSNPFQSKLYRFVQKKVAAFQVLKELIEENLGAAAKVIADPENLKEKIYQISEEKYNEIRDRVSRGIVRSIIYIFVTKIIFAIAIEIPYEYYFLGGVSLIPIASTVMIPLIFVFLVALTIKRPSEANTERIAELIFDFVYWEKDKEKIEFSFGEKKRGLTYKIFGAAYGIAFILIFSLISYWLAKFGFNIVGIAIFFIFLSLVLLFGFRVKFSASELNVVTIKENLASNVLTNLSLPFLDLGVWLADKFAQLNFFILLFDFLIEAPLKNILGVLDEWASYLKERKEEAIEIPVER